MMITELRVRLGDELERLSRELDAHVHAALEEGEESSPIAREGRLGHCRQRVAMLGRMIAGLAEVDPAIVPADRAGFGSTVRVRDVSAGEESSFTLMTGDLMNVDEGHVSLASPIGNALLGRRAGEVVTVQTPRGQRRFEVLEVCTLYERAGVVATPPPCATQIRVA